jgi:hypothetical protein
MELRLTAYVVGVALSMATSLAAIASQSGRFVGVHEVPPFVCDRVELVAVLSHHRAGGSTGERAPPEDAVIPAGRSSICARGAGG